MDKQNILLDLLVWYQSKNSIYRNETLLVDVVDDFIDQYKSGKRKVSCNSIDDAKENMVAILVTLSSPHCPKSNLLDEIEIIANETYQYLKKQKQNG